MLQSAIEPRRAVLLFLKAFGPNSFAGKAGYAKYGNPPRWHKVSHEAPAPKGAPLAAHPHAGGQHEPAKHFTDDEWSQLKLPESNTNAPHFNKLLDTLKQHSEAGDVTAILGSSFGTNTYGKKAATIANKLLEMHGSAHKVTPGQKAGWHAAVEHHVGQDTTPAPPAADAPPEKDATPAAEVAELKAEPGVQIGAVEVPQFSAKKEGIVEYYQSVVSKILAFAQAGDAEGLAAMVNPKMGTWSNVTPNSKKLVAYHAAVTAAMNKATPEAAAAEPPTPAAAAVEESQTAAVAKKLEGMSLNEKQLVVDKAMGGLFTDEHKALWSNLNDNAKGDIFDAFAAVQEMFQSMQASGMGATEGKHAAVWSALPFPMKAQLIQGASTFIPKNTAETITQNGFEYKKDPGARYGWQYEVEGKWFDVQNPHVVKQLNADHGKPEGAAEPGVHQLDEPKPTTVGAPSVDPVAEAKPPAHALLDQIPWDNLKLPDSNTNAKSVNPKLEKLKAAAYAGDAAALQAMSFGKNTYNKKLEKVHAAVLEALAAQPAPAAADTGPKEGDTKQGADGTLVLKNGHWVKQDEAAPALSSHEQSVLSSWQSWVKNGKVQALSKALDTYKKIASAAKVHAALIAEGEKLLAQHVSAPATPPPLPTFTGEGVEGFESAANNIKAMVDAVDVAGLEAAAAKFKAYASPGIPPSVTLSEYADAALAYAKTGPAPVKAAPEPMSQATKESLDDLAAGGFWDELQDQIDNTSNATKKAYAERLMKQKPGAAPASGAPPKPDVGVSVHWQEVMNQVANAYVAKDLETLKTQYAQTKNLLSEGSKVVHQYAADCLTKLGVPLPDDGPKEGDTKQGVGGMLIFHNGHWILMHAKLTTGEANMLASGVKPKGSNGPKLKAMAVAGDAEGIKKMLDGFSPKQPASKLYATKLLIAMQEKAKKLAPSAMSAPAVAPKPAAAPAPAAQPWTPPGGVVELDGPESMDGWKQVGPQGGSNPGGAFIDDDGVKWYCKFPPNPEHAKSEVLASKLYEAAGVSAQDAKLVMKNGKIGIASKWNEVTPDPAGLHSKDGAQSGFVVDAWLANYDVVGPDFKNMQVDANGKAFRVDAGGSLEFRAQGKKKTDFGTTVKEIDTLRDPKVNPATAKVFGSMTDADLTASAKKVLSISDDEIIDLVMAHGPGDDAAKAALAEKLIARKQSIAKKFPKAVPKVPKVEKPDPTKLKVKAEDIPEPPDFVGMKVSSKAHVNESNAKDAKTLHDFAMKGNLVALKDYHYEAIDKETGKSMGSLPIEKHPSKQVKNYWSDLVSALNFVANPPAKLDIKTKITGTVKKVSEVFKSAKYGVTTSSAAASSRLAFWIALGATKPALALLPKNASSTDFQSNPTDVPKVTKAMSDHAVAKYKSLKSDSLVKRFINGIQSSGTYNDNFRDGKMVTADGKDARQMVLDAYAYADEKPEGFEIYKWIHMSPDMVKQLHSAPEGTVFQNPGSMCCSTGTSGTAGFGSHRVRIRYAQGAKAVDSYGSGDFKSEKEITTLPGQRFVILSCKTVQCPIKNAPRMELDVLMLPPDPSYLAEMEASLKGA